MPKLSASHQFLDLSDYGRPLAKYCAEQLKNTRLSPIHITLIFGLTGLLAVYCILGGHYKWASLFILLKAVIDAVDGELARAKNKPSYSGRYLDSIFDLVLNFLFLMSICYVSDTTFWTSLSAFIALQLQGTLYNYYYVILRNNAAGGDTTSKIIEDCAPKALPGESQKAVNDLFRIYRLVYGIFDKAILSLDRNASRVKGFPNWFMTLLSLYGLGFQLLIMAILLPLGFIEYISPFFICYSVLIVFLIAIRKLLIK